MRIGTSGGYDCWSSFYQARSQSGTGAGDDANYCSGGDMIVREQRIQKKAVGPGVYASSAGSYAGYGDKTLRAFANQLSGIDNKDLIGLNVNRKLLGDRIACALDAAHITLGKDEKLAVSVDARNVIRVGGVADKAKAKAIEDALNNDALLGRELRKHNATSKIAQYTRSEQDRQAVAVSVPEGGDASAADDAVSRGMRSFVIEEYLQQNAGASLADLALEKGDDDRYNITGMNASLAKMVEEDKDLGVTIANMLENGETAATRKATFEFANGAIVDGETSNAAKQKLEELKAKLSGNKDGIFAAYAARAEASGRQLDPKLKEMLQRGFSIRVSANGSFDIVGAEDLDDESRGILRQLVQEGLSQWAGDGLGVTGETRIATLADVAQAFLENHRYETGNTSEFQHFVEIDLGASGAGASVVSPEADAARDNANNVVGSALAGQLEAMLGDKGLAVRDLEFQMNADGKITVLGNADAEVMSEAQFRIDQFVRECRGEDAREAARARAKDETERRWRGENTVVAEADPEVDESETARLERQAESLRARTSDGTESGEAWSSYEAWRATMGEVSDDALSAIVDLRLDVVNDDKYVAAAKRTEKRDTDRLTAFQNYHALLGGVVSMNGGAFRFGGAAKTE